jgi:hypothetical protein
VRISSPAAHMQLKSNLNKNHCTWLWATLNVTGNIMSLIQNHCTYLWVKLNIAVNKRRYLQLLHNLQCKRRLYPT